jgi:hypothetical protein
LHVSPLLIKQAFRTVVVPAGHRQTPPVSQTRPAAAQSNSQQRPPWQLLPEPTHWLLWLQPVLPTGMRLLQSPVAALQPLPHAAKTKALLTHVRELPPWQLGGPPSH